MRERSELKCAMCARVWLWLIGGIAALIVGLAVTASGRGVLRVLGVIVALGGFALLACVALSRRTRLVADENGLSYHNWKGGSVVPWRQLSSLQFRREPGGGRVTAMVVVNDTGRKAMEVPAYLFDSKALHDFVAALPTSSSGRGRLLD